MASELGVQTIQHTNGTDAMTIDSSGRVNMPNTIMVDMYRMTSDVTVNATTITAWEQVDDASYSSVGSTMSVSSGIFTFPTTGLYRITHTVRGFSSSGQDNYLGTESQVSRDSGSNYDGVFSALGSVPSGGSGNASGCTLVNVTDTSQVKFRIRSDSVGGSSRLHGNSTMNITWVMFEYIAPAQ